MQKCTYKSNEKFFIQAYKNLGSTSNEAWFGENNSFKLEVVAIFRKLKALYNNAHSVSNFNKIKFVDSITDELVSLEHVIEKNLNVESCKIGVINEFNACSLLMCWDKTIIGKTIEAKKIRLELEDIVETKQGIKFKSNREKYIAVTFGLPMLSDPNFTAEECAGIIFHEFGHAFQQLMIGINASIAQSAIAENLKDAYTNLKLTNVIGNVLTGNILYALFMPFISVSKTLQTGLLQFQTRTNNKTAQLGDKILDKMDESDTIDRQDTTLKNSNLNREMIENSITHPVDKNKSKFLNSIAIIFLSILSPFIYVLDLPANIYLWTNLKWLRKNRKFEEFADMFAAYYGLGSSLASALAKLGKDYQQCDLTAFNFLNYVPLVNLIIDSYYYYQINIQLICSGYPAQKTRLAVIYKSMEYDLNNNKSISELDKQDIRKQMEETEKIYNDYVFGKGAKNFVYKIYQKMIHASIHKDAKSADIETNVIDAIEEHKFLLNEEKNKINFDDKKENNNDIYNTKTLAI
jgi:hypothetical protein